ncbi:hypothetical protein BH24ACT22_BH24ACT22_08550 [soil metagenome]
MKIQDITTAIELSRILLTDHADEKAQADELSFEAVYFSVLHGEIVEDYPTDALIRVV